MGEEDPRIGKEVICLLRICRDIFGAGLEELWENLEEACRPPRMAQCQCPRRMHAWLDPCTPRLIQSIIGAPNISVRREVPPLGKVVDVEFDGDCAFAG